MLKKNQVLDSISIGRVFKLLLATLLFAQSGFAQSSALSEMKLYAQKGSDTTQVLLEKIKPTIDFKNGNDIALEYLLINFRYHLKARKKIIALQALEDAKLHYDHSSNDNLKLGYELALAEHHNLKLEDYEPEARACLKKAIKGNFPEHIVEANILLFRIYRRRAEKDSMAFYLDKALRVAKKNDLKLKEARVLRIKGGKKVQQLNYDEALQYYDRSLELFRRLGFEVEVARTLTYKARIYRYRELYEEAVQLYQQAIAIFEKYSVSYEVGLVNRYMGLIYQNLDNHEEAIKQLDFTKRILGDSLFPFIVARINSELGDSYLALHNYEVAENLFKESITLKEKINDHYTLPNSYSGLGTLYLKQGKLDQAQIQFEKAIDLSEKIKSKKAIVATYLGLSQLFLEKKNFKSAKKYGKLCLEYAKKNGAIETKFASLLVLAKVASEQGNYAQANQYYRSSAELQDSVMNFKKSLKVINIISAYENKKKEFELLSLKSENQAKASELEQNQLLSKLYLLGFISIVVSFLLFLRSFIQNRKARQQQQRLNASLNESNRKLSESNAQLDQFAHTASHDLKSPLTAINLFSSFLESNTKTKVGEKERRYIQGISKSGKNLVAMIDDMLDFSKVGAKTLNLEVIDLDRMVKETISSLLGCALENEIELKQLRPFPDAVLVDEVKLKRVFQNIIANAIKFMDVNKKCNYVHLDYEKLDDFYQFTIRDNGIGIPKTGKNIFHPFTSLNKKEDYKGTGIGLAICEKIIGKHGGSIWYESELGIGTSFYFTIKSPEYLD
ncbi:tetratricopeptide repeat protein [bacterium]|nr:tetratricopeptide repeat protein [bacterium]